MFLIYWAYLVVLPYIYVNIYETSEKAALFLYYNLWIILGKIEH